jgi:hypothetical protein
LKDESYFLVMREGSGYLFKKLFFQLQEPPMYEPLQDYLASSLSAFLHHLCTAQLVEKYAKLPLFTPPVSTAL